MPNGKNWALLLTSLFSVGFFYVVITYNRVGVVAAYTAEEPKPVERVTFGDDDLIVVDNPLESAVKKALNEAIGFSNTDLNNVISAVEEAADNGYEYNVAIDEVVDTILFLTEVQPAFNANKEGGLPRAIDLGSLIFKYSVRNALPRLVVASMGMRESSFRLAVEDGRIKGTRDEEGLFQIMPKGKAYSMSDKCNMLTRECNIKTATNYLSYVRDRCVKKLRKRCTTSTWVAWYGRRKALTPYLAEHAPEVRAAKRWICKTRPLMCNIFWNYD